MPPRIKASKRAQTAATQRDSMARNTAHQCKIKLWSPNRRTTPLCQPSAALISTFGGSIRLAYGSKGRPNSTTMVLAYTAPPHIPCRRITGTIIRGLYSPLLPWYPSHFNKASHTPSQTLSPISMPGSVDLSPLPRYTRTYPPSRPITPHHTR